MQTNFAKYIKEMLECKDQKVWDETIQEIGFWKNRATHEKQKGIGALGECLMAQYIAGSSMVSIAQQYHNGGMSKTEPLRDEKGKFISKK